ncbi:hypothetical protein HQQ80_13595 [Microbacteriaceae bacterium VKM Ac-2855]|nr:hypothetical protein [Microbacteriaceae bacterium VKM Ac-2855]
MIILIVVVVLLIWRPWAGASSAPTPVVTPSETPLPTIYPSSPAAGVPETPTGEAAATPTPTCSASDVSVTAVTDASSYAAGAIPQLSLTLTNTSAADCVINAGTSQQVFTITSGSDTIWRSSDCQSEPNDLEILLTAGQTVNGTPIPWDRTRSSTATCAGGREAVTAGGAAYNLSVSVAGITSASTAQFLLN